MEFEKRSWSKHLYAYSDDARNELTDI